MKTFGLSLTLITAAAIAACDRGRQQATEWSASAPTQFCTDGAGRRVPDDYCARRGGYAGGGGIYTPYFVGRGGYIPPYGGLARGGVLTPSAGVAYGHAAAFTSSAPLSTGGGHDFISRGGFGASAAAHGGDGGGE